MTRVQDRMDIRTVHSVGKTRQLTPEGYLLCRDVAVARTGHMLYGAGEVPLDDDGGLITVNREADELFKPETLASFEGKAVTNNHPDDWVNPQNWKQLAVGTGFNFRRGEGVEDHLLLADLLVTDAQAIKDIQHGKVEISLGYDADYTQAGKGKGFQTNILGNHIALVDKGRCGSRCKIGDGKTMPKKKAGWLDRLYGLKQTVDATLAEAERDAPDSHDAEPDDVPEADGEQGAALDAKTLDRILKAIQALDAKYDKRLKTLEKQFKDVTQPEHAESQDDDDDGYDDGDEDHSEDGYDDNQDDEHDDQGTYASHDEGDDGQLDDEGFPLQGTARQGLKRRPRKGGKAQPDDHKYTGDSLADLRSRAEILSPGMKLPTLDAAAKGIKKLARTCKCNALRAAYSGSNQHLIDAFTGGRDDFEALPESTLDVAFIGASELIRQRNNAAGARSGISTQDFGRAPRSPAEINAANRQYWNDRAHAKA